MVENYVFPSHRHSCSKHTFCFQNIRLYKNPDETEIQAGYSQWLLANIPLATGYKEQDEDRGRQGSDRRVSRKK